MVREQKSVSHCLTLCLTWFHNSFSGTTPALSGLAALLSAVILGAHAADLYWPAPLGYTLCSAAVLGLILLGLFLSGKLLRTLLGRSLRCLLSAALLYSALLLMIWRGAGEGITIRVVLFSALMALSLWLFTGAAYALLRLRRRTPTLFITALLSAGAVLLFALFLFTDGFDDHYIQHYLTLGPQREAADIALTPGPYSVDTMDYGTEEGLPSETVDLSPFVSRDSDKVNGAYADLYLDYDLTAVPLTGRIYLPAGQKNCPLLMIAHGNHEIAVDSYLGYDYLGEYLASCGYAVVSVDQNACNMLTGENAGRAVLLLEHIGWLLDRSAQRDHPLYGLLDRENIAIAGHSRGGEMIAAAYLFNDYDRYPENGTIRFDYHYPIKALIAIAPTVDQYRPADHSVELTDINYLLLHGACDRDVTSVQGMKQYENISFTGEGDYLKSALYIAGANHGQFNTLWGAYDQPAPFSSLLNVEGLLPAEEQQAIAAKLIKAFLDLTLRGDPSGEALLTDWDSRAGELPETVYVQCYERSSFRPIADFEEDSDLQTATGESVSLHATGVSVWTEERMNTGAAPGTHALRLRWAGHASYTAALPPTDTTSLSLSFDIADLSRTRVEQENYRLLNCEVRLTDSQGHTAAAQLSDYATVYPPLPVRTDKLDYLFNTRTYRHALATVTIPTESFDAEEGFDPTNVAEVSFLFDSSGEVMMDNIGWS